MINLKKYDFRLSKVGDEIDDFNLKSEKYVSYFVYLVDDKFYMSIDFLHEFMPKPGDAFRFLTKITEIFIEISQEEFYSLYHKYNGKEFDGNS